MLLFTGFYAFLFMSTRRWRNRSLPWRRIYTTHSRWNLFIYSFYFICQTYVQKHHARQNK